MKKIVLLGSGGHAKSVVDAIETSGSYKIVGFIDNEERITAYRGYQVIGKDKDLRRLYDSGVELAFICVGYLGQSQVRNRLYSMLKQIGFQIPIVTDPNAVLAEDVSVGEGTFIGKGAVINSGAIIGKMAIINTAAVVEHDCKIGDFCHIAVNSTLCGGVVVESGCFIGAGATVIQGINIGENSVIGAGSVIVKDVEKNIKYVNRITAQITQSI